MSVERVPAWTDEEKRFLVANHSTMTRKQLEEALGRSKNSVAGQCMRMGLKVDVASKAYHKSTAQPRYRNGPKRPGGAGRWAVAYTPDIDAQLIKLYFDDGYSATMVAKMIGHGLTKSRVQNRVNTLANGRRKGCKPIAALTARTPAAPRARAPKTPAVRPALENAITIMQLTLNTCRAPVGEAVGRDQLFCGQVVGEGQTYCTYCRSILYEPPKNRARR